MNSKTSNFQGLNLTVNSLPSINTHFKLVLQDIVKCIYRKKLRLETTWGLLLVFVLLLNKANSNIGQKACPTQINIEFLKQMKTSFKLFLK